MFWIKIHLLEEEDDTGLVSLPDAERPGQEKKGHLELKEQKFCEKEALKLGKTFQKRILKKMSCMTARCNFSCVLDLV